MQRRTFLTLTASQLGINSLGLKAQAAPPKAGRGIRFAFGTYGMKSLSPAEAIKVCERIGYDAIDLALMDGWPTEPTQLTPADRSELRNLLRDTGLALPAMLESLHCLKSGQEHASNLERLRRATQLAHDLSPDEPPIVQSIAGGKPTEWKGSRKQLVDELGDWASIAEATKTVVCFKPHASHVLNDVERTLWVHRQINSPWLRVVYDYSHFFLEGLSIEDSLLPLLPVTAYVQVKDSRWIDPPATKKRRKEYLLPGEGETDYLQLLTLLKQHGYRGAVGVEVSSMIHRKPDYNAINAAKLCHSRLAPIFAKLDH